MFYEVILFDSALKDLTNQCELDQINSHYIQFVNDGCRSMLLLSVKRVDLVMCSML